MLVYNYFSRKNIIFIQLGILSKYCAVNVDKTDTKNAKSESKLLPDDEALFVNEEHPKLGNSVNLAYVSDLLTIGISKQNRKVAFTSTPPIELPLTTRNVGDEKALALVGDR